MQDDAPLGRLEDLPAEYVQALRDKNLVPLWPSLRGVLPPTKPQPRTRATAWSYQAIKPLLLQADSAASARSVLHEQTDVAVLLLDVVMEADHFCMHWRGVKDSETKMVNSVMRGSFLKDAALRREFLSLINLKA